LINLEAFLVEFYSESRDLEFDQSAQVT